MTSSPKYEVISADNHIIEAPNAFADHIDKAFLDQAPRLMKREDGVDAAAIFPMASIESFVIDDRPFAVAVMRAYNDWLMNEFCAPDPKRLLGLPLMPVDDGMDVLVAEFRRVLDKGAKGVFLPYYASRSYSDPFFDPFWKEASESGTPLCMHRMVWTSPGRRGHPAGRSRRRPEHRRQRHWAKPPLTIDPKEFVGKNVFVALLDDHVGYAMARDYERVAKASMFSTDYPHGTTLFPDTHKYVDELRATVPADAAEAILAGNAIRVFNLA